MSILEPATSVAGFFIKK